MYKKLLLKSVRKPFRKIRFVSKKKYTFVVVKFLLNQFNT